MMNPHMSLKTGSFKLITAGHGYLCQEGSRVKASLVTAAESQDGVPPTPPPTPLQYLTSLEVQRDLFSL